MDSAGNSSCSLQSSASAGDEEEYDSRPRPPPPQQLQHDHQQQQASLNFLNPFSSNSLLFSHQHPNSLFDPSQSFFHPFSNHQHQSPPPSHHSSFLNLDMVPSSSHHQTTLPASSAMLAQSSSPSSSSLPHATGLRTANHHPPPPAAINNDRQSNTTGAPRNINPEHHHHNQQQQQSGTTTPPTRNPKKRTRASRRAPTTVLTTDTSNFRAMVQEFTGIPAPPFSAASPYSRLDLFGSSALRSAAGFDSIYPLRPAAHKLHHHPSHHLPSTDLPSNPSSVVGNFQLGPSAQNMMMNQMLSLQSMLHSHDLHHSLKSQSGGGLIGVSDDQLGTMGNDGWADRAGSAPAIDDVGNRDREVGNNNTTSSSSNNNVVVGTYEGSNSEQQQQQKSSFTATGSGPEFILHHQNV